MQSQNIQDIIVLLTHEHYDHISGVNWLRENFPETRVVCSEACSKAIMSPHKNLSAYYEILFMGKDPEVQEYIKNVEVPPYSCEADETFQGQEVMPVKQLNYWKKYLPNLKTIANVYGPTEATVNCTYYIVDREFSDSEVLPLGKACENTGLLVLDEDNTIIDSSKVNELGELCVYGSSLSAGYWDDEEKTKEKQIVLFYQGDIEEEALKEYLLTIIPKYMVPTVYIPLKKFPYNDNGKIDRKKLENDYLS